MNELQKRAFVAGAKWAYGINYTPPIQATVKQEAARRYTPKPTCYDCHWQFDNPFDEHFCKKGFKATRVCKRFKRRTGKVVL